MLRVPHTDPFTGEWFGERFAVEGSSLLRQHHVKSGHWYVGYATGSQTRALFLSQYSLIKIIIATGSSTTVKIELVFLSHGLQLSVQAVSPDAI